MKCIHVSVSLDPTKYDSSDGPWCVAAIVNALMANIHSKRFVIFDVFASDLMEPFLTFIVCFHLITNLYVQNVYESDNGLIKFREH